MHYTLIAGRLKSYNFYSDFFSNFNFEGGLAATTQNGSGNLRFYFKNGQVHCDFWRDFLSPLLNKPENKDGIWIVKK